MTSNKNESPVIKTKKKEVEVAKDAAFTPPSGVIICAPIKRVRKGTPVSHETNFKYGAAYNKYVLPTINISGRAKYKNPFRSKAEQAYIEKQLGEDLNPNNFKNEFWADFVVTLRSTKETFDLSDPIQLLAVRVLECWTDVICTVPEERLNKITYQYLLSTTGFQERESEEIGDRLAEVWGFYKKIKDNRKELISFLKLRGENPPSNVDLKWLRARVIDEIQGNPTDCWIQISDEDREIKVILDRALASGAVLFSTNGYTIKDSSEVLAANKDNVILYLKRPENAEELQKIKAHIKEYESKFMG